MQVCRYMVHGLPSAHPQRVTRLLVHVVYIIARLRHHNRDMHMCLLHCTFITPLPEQTLLTASAHGTFRARRRLLNKRIRPRARYSCRISSRPAGSFPRWRGTAGGNLSRGLTRPPNPLQSHSMSILKRPIRSNACMLVHSCWNCKTGIRVSSYTGKIHKEQRKMNLAQELSNS